MVKMVMAEMIFGKIWGIGMATKKYYAVKKGKKTGIFKTWEECRASVDGCPGAEYKGFGQLAEAEAYLGAALSGKALRGEEKALFP